MCACVMRGGGGFMVQNSRLGKTVRISVSKSTQMFQGNCFQWEQVILLCFCSCKSPSHLPKINGQGMTEVEKAQGI